MLFPESVVKVVDNSGGLRLKCIRVLDYRTAAVPGILILASAKQVKPHKKVRKGAMYKCVVVQTRRGVGRLTGSYVKSDRNAVVILRRRENLPIANRLYSWVFWEVRDVGYLRVATLARDVI